MQYGSTTVLVYIYVIIQYIYKYIYVIIQELKIETK